ncbi:hypothetical protein AO398_25370 [Methylobacterium sp. GXS13]|uniref:hypothetical protein n=1 Tax=Methylobacterium sp. GXS13 TaxID=1730094 RepID=UPI00071BEF8B|nr:hypothetical protein [Methylobacterium sp. GXS13]KST57283.1 hypothetical protein AO398_25370 [Methylobacterium sp. GXS13]
MVTETPRESEAKTPDAFDAMAGACIDNHEAIMRHGSPEMQTASRMLLYALAEEVRRRSDGMIAGDED